MSYLTLITYYFLQNGELILNLDLLQNNPVAPVQQTSSSTTRISRQKFLSHHPNLQPPTAAISGSTFKYKHLSITCCCLEYPQVDISNEGNDFTLLGLSLLSPSRTKMLRKTRKWLSCFLLALSWQIYIFLLISRKSSIFISGHSSFYATVSDNLKYWVRLKYV